MKIADLLAEINIEVLRLMAFNADSGYVDQIDSMNPTLKKLKSLFDAIEKKSSELDKSLGFFEKMELKSDLKELLKVMKNSKNDDQWKIFESSSLLLKLCLKYKAEVTYDTPKKEDTIQATDKKQDEFNLGLEDRIESAFKAAREKRAKQGVQVDEPVMTINVNEVREASERAAKIDRIMAKKRAEEQERAEIAAKVSIAIEKKKAEQRRRSINPDENTRYEGVMAKKIKELLQDFEEEKKGDTVSIRYEYQNDTYYIDGEPVIKKPRRLITLKEKSAYIKSKLRNQSEFGYLFDSYIPDDMKALKNCDPYIIGLLISKDIRLARDYIKQMSGNPYKKMSPQEFNVTYDVRGLEHDKGSISSKERRHIRKIAKQQRNAAKVLEDKRKLPWFVAIPVAGALAIAGIAGITASNNTNQNNDKDTLSGNSYSDTVEPGTTYEDDEHIIEKITTEYSSEPEYTTDFNTGTTTYTTTTTMATTEAAVETTTVTTPSKGDNETSIDDGNHKDDKNEESSRDNREDDIQEEKTIINIGDKIMVQDGLKYTADCLGGGNSNKIGAVSWRPATEYNIEKVAFVYQGKVLKIMNRGSSDIEQTLQDIASQNGINMEDINTSVLLSLVPGTADTGWANISIDEMRQNVSKPAEEQSNMISHVDFDFDR